MNENAAALPFDAIPSPCPAPLNMDLMTPEQIAASLEAGYRDWLAGRSRPAEEAFAALENRLGV